MQADLTSKRSLLLVTILSASKRYTEDYWLLYIQYREGEWSMLILLQFSWNWTMKGAFYAIVYWTIMIIVHLICMFLICQLSWFFSQITISDMLSFLSQFFWISQRVTKSYIFNFDLRHYWKIHNSHYIYTKNTERQGNSSSKTIVRGYISIQFKPPAAGKLHQTTTVSSQCGWLY